MRVDGTLSNKLPITAGVPRGSVMVPLLFLLYINELPDSIVSDTRLYADDTSNLYFHAPNHEITHSINTDLARIQEWSEKWLIRFNEEKRNLSITKNKDSIVSSPQINSSS